MLRPQNGRSPMRYSDLPNLRFRRKGAALFTSLSGVRDAHFVVSGEALKQLTNTTCSYGSNQFKKPIVAHIKGRRRTMRSSAFGVFGAALIGALSSCVYVPPEPAPPYPYVEPVPLALPPPGPSRLCGRGWHWVHGHHTRSGRWVPGHCVRNWVSPPRSKEEAPPAAEPNVAPAAPAEGAAPEKPPSPAPPTAGPMAPGR
jgi:hypothetical protein